jgi:hypothetical protein
MVKLVAKGEEAQTGGESVGCLVKIIA